MLEPTAQTPGFSSPKKKASFLLAFLIISFSGGGFSGYYLGSKNTGVPLASNTTQNKVDQTDTPSFRPRPYRRYNQDYLKQLLPVSQLQEFRNSFHDVSFRYLKSSYLNSLEADSKHDYLLIGLTEQIDYEDRKILDGYIECNQSNRQEPAGLCQEGLIAPLEIVVTPLDESSKKLIEVDWRFTDNTKICEREDDGEKVVFSCLSNNNIGSSAMYEFIVYPQGRDSKVVLILSTFNPPDKEVQVIIDSFQSN